MLKASYNTLNEVPENLRSEYKEVEGIFVLDGFVPKGKLDEFRTNNRALAKEREKLQEQLLKFKDVDPDKYAESVAKLQELENSRLAEAGEWKTLKANLEQQHADLLKTEKAKAAMIQEGWNKEKIANQTAMLVLKHAVPADGNMKYIQSDIQAVTAIDPETSKIVFLNKNGVPEKNKAGDGNLTLEEYLTETYIPKSSLFKKSEGGGALGADVPMISKGQVSVDNVSGKEISGDMLSKLATGEIKAI